MVGTYTIGGEHFFMQSGGGEPFFCQPDIVFISDNHIINATSLMLDDMGGRGSTFNEVIKESPFLIRLQNLAKPVLYLSADYTT